MPLAGCGVTDQPPHDIPAEQHVLGSMMLAENVIPDVFRVLGDHPIGVQHGRLIVDEDNPFYRPAHQLIYATIIDLWDKGTAPDPVMVVDLLTRRGWLGRVGSGTYLHTLISQVPTPANAAHYAKIVYERWRERDKNLLADRIRQADADTARELVADWAADQATEQPGRAATGRELADFLTATPPDPDWLVKGLLERRDRLILTGGEGHGKSTLLRQIGVQLASGVHPFGGPDFAPVRVLLVDLENSERQLHPKLRGLFVAAGNRYGGGFIIATRLEGLDLAHGDGEILTAEVHAAKPDVLITGPAYKMVAGDPTEEGPARLVAAHLDKIRSDFGCAVILEAHSPHASNGGKRPTRPYGASLWLRWPEFGLHIAENGMVTHWRGPREERDWPAALQRGGDWPWTPVTRPRDVLWAQIVNRCQQAGDQIAERDLAVLLAVSKSSIHRAIEEHAAEWERLADGGAS